MLAGNLRQSSTTHSIKLGKYGLRTTWKLDMAVWDMWDMLLKEDRAADVMNHRNYNMTQSKLKLESSELVSLEFSVFGAGSCWPISGTAFCEVRRFRRQLQWHPNVSQRLLNDLPSKDGSSALQRSQWWSAWSSWQLTSSYILSLAWAASVDCDCHLSPP